MPKENRKRGRREELKKRKRDAEDHDADAKRHKQTDDAHHDFAVAQDDQVNFQEQPADGVSRPDDTPFYGMLDEEEQEYFKKADEMLELNDFEGPDGRSLFLQNVYREANGKELKIANSQSCSRLMERLILLSTPQQLKDLFQKFSGQYVASASARNLFFSLTACLDSFTLCSTDLPPTVAKLSSYEPPTSSPKSIPSQSSYKRRLRPIPMRSLSPWKICSYIP